MDFNQARFNMVEQQIRPWNVLDFDVLDALSDIPREAFVQESQRGYAYSDAALPLPNGSLMLEPKVVARMVQGLTLQKNDRVLEIGTGSGYATAVLAALAGEVVSIDIDETQQQAAQKVLAGLNISNVSFRVGDGLAAGGEGDLFDAVYVGGSVESLPDTLLAQLAEGGRLVVIAGEAPVQQCRLFVRSGSEFKESVLFDTSVAALDGRALKAPRKFKF